MFTLPHRRIATLTATLALAGAFGSAAVAPQAARADAVCRYWRIPADFNINQSNGWRVATTSKIGAYKWRIFSWNASVPGVQYGTLNLTRFDVSGIGPRVEFTVTLDSSWSVGVYTGTIDPNGFLAGMAYDQHSPGNTATWFAHTPIGCA